MPNSNVDDIDEIIREADHGDHIVGTVRHHVDPLSLLDAYFKSFKSQSEKDLFTRCCPT